MGKNEDGKKREEKEKWRGKRKKGEEKELKSAKKKRGEKTEREKEKDKGIIKVRGK